MTHCDKAIVWLTGEPDDLGAKNRIEPLMRFLNYDAATLGMNSGRLTQIRPTRGTYKENQEANDYALKCFHLGSLSLLD